MIPYRWRSAGTNPMPRWWRRRGLTPVASLRPPRVTVPEVTCLRPTSASTISSWPFPATPAMPRISPERTSKLTSWTTSWPRSSFTWSPFTDAERRVAGMALAAVHRELDLASDHQLGEVVLVRLRRDATADDLPAPDDGDLVRDLEDLVELVADEDDWVPALGAAGGGRRRSRASPAASGRRSARRGRGSFALRYSALRISTRCCQPTDERADLGVGIDLEAERPRRARECGRARAWRSRKHRVAPSARRRARCSPPR